MTPASTHSPVRALVSLGMLVAALLAAGLRCAQEQCQINSDCGPMHYCDSNQICRQQCALDRDCVGGATCNANGQCVMPAHNDAAVQDVAGSEDVLTVPDVLGLDIQPVDTGEDVQPDLGPEPLDGGEDVPPPPVDTGVDVGPVDTGVDVAPIDTGVDVHVIMDVPVAMDIQGHFDTGVDVPPPPVDTGIDVPRPPVDTGVDVPPADAGHHGAYLDPCTLSTDCMSNECYVGAGGNRFCSQACTVQVQCGAGYECISGYCMADDTGTPCTISASTCHYACFSAGSPPNAQCTHLCNTGGDCPAGYACSGAGGAPAYGAPYVCMQIEIPQSDGCPGLIYSTSTGCSARCRTAADCPTVFQSLIADGAEYTCDPAIVLGVATNVCTPPLGVMGSAPMGTTCSATAEFNTCRSESCDTSTTPPVCVQACTERGGCPSNWGCKPEQNTSGGFDLLCRPAGSGPLGSPCERGSDCATALCESVTASTGYCTRLCGEDGHCPTGMTCTDSLVAATDGTEISICTM